MTRESVQDKAVRLLLAKRVTLWRVSTKRVDATVYGDTGTYRVLWHSGRWSCSCPAHGPCAHVGAVMHVCLPPPSYRHNATTPEPPKETP